MAQPNTNMASRGASYLLEAQELIKNPVLALTMFVLLALAMVLVPLPGQMLDFFMMLNFIFALVIIITVINSKEAIDFSSFPIALLFATAFRLAVNISSTRLILSKGIDFDGQVVRAFSSFVTGGSYLIGIVIFIIILTVQFFVITRGANRASEVSARFKLDALPGKQMAIDADLNAGLIDERTAVQRRINIQREADFYGSMDGAAKFVSGEVIASFIIILINVLGGIIIGTVIRSETLAEASTSYISFAIGDGLVASIPSLLTAVASGIIVTRNSDDKGLAQGLFDQMFRAQSTFYLVGGFVFFVAMLPGFPKLVLVPFSLAIIFFAYRMSVYNKTQEAEERVATTEKMSPSGKEEMSPEKIVEGIQVDPLEIELGYELIALADTKKGGDLLERVKKCRRQLALELGLVIPRVRIADNMQLGRSEYQIKMNGAVLSSVLLQLGKYMAIESGQHEKEPGMRAIKEPVFGLNAYWISEEEKTAFEKKGYTVVDCATIIATHLSELMKRHSSEIVGRKETQAILDVVAKTNQPLISELKNLNIKISNVQAVFRGLLAERVSIRNVQSILENMCDAKTGDQFQVELVIEKVRYALRRQICAQHGDEGNNINAVVFSTPLEEELLSLHKDAGGVSFLAISPNNMQQLIKSIGEVKKSVEEKGYKPLLVCDGMLRRPVAKIFANAFPGMYVLSADEVADGYYLNFVGTVQA